MWACSRPLNSRALEPRHISEFSDTSASAMVDEVGRSLAGAVGRSISAVGKSCSLNALSKTSRVANCCANAMGHQTHAVV